MNRISALLLALLMHGGLPLPALALDYPDRKLTPGLVRPDATKAQLCAPGFTTRKYRHTTAAMKRQVCRAYHIQGKCPDATRLEVDHLVALEEGGSDDTRNLWIQMFPAAHWKDRVEDCLHKLVCAGKVELHEAQQRLIEDWYKEYLREQGVGCGG